MKYQRTLGVRTLILDQRNPGNPIVLHFTSGNRWVGNVYDPDGSRVEVDDR
jgi:hypothetical protein